MLHTITLKISKLLVVIALVIFAAGASAFNFNRAYRSITENDLAGHTAILASDRFEGRAPGGVGEKLTLAYLERQYRRMGYLPLNQGSYVQKVPLIEIVGSDVSLTIPNLPLVYKSDFVATSRHITESISVTDAELVYVGYGINAPEYQWNDYDGIDVKGKIVVALVNDPGFATGDSELFQGKTMTYYGRWTYKYEEASRQGAAGIFIIHEDAAASYPWSVVEGGWSGPQFDLVRSDNNAKRVKVEGWLSTSAAQKLFENNKLDYAQQLESAKSREFKALSLGATASVSLTNTIKESASRNFIATLPGAGNSEEHIIYMGHWDHMGKNDDLEGDKIYNGAQDNASGISGLIEIAEAFTMLKKRPARSITFIAMAAEEQGLLGSAYYAENPIIPLDKTIAAINMDSLNLAGQVKDLMVIGFGKSELETYLAIAAKKQNRALSQETNPAAGSFYRSDHFNFAKKGVPALYARGGTAARTEELETKRQENLKKLGACYHQPCDEVAPFWDYSGAVDDLRIFFDVGHQLATSQAYPNWYESAEFRRARDAYMNKASTPSEEVESPESSISTEATESDNS